MNQQIVGAAGALFLLLEHFDKKKRGEQNVKHVADNNSNSSFVVDVDRAGIVDSGVADSGVVVRCCTIDSAVIKKGDKAEFEKQQQQKVKEKEQQPQRTKIIRKRLWMREFLKKRENRHGKAILTHEIPFSAFIKSCHISRLDFDMLLNLLQPHISRQKTHFRSSITPKERLALTLRYLKSGDSYNTLMQRFRISKSSISTIIPEVCKEIIKVLQNKWSHATHKTLGDWQTTSKTFAKCWKFPNCLGVLATKSTAIQTTIIDAEIVQNSKLILLVMVDANYCIQYSSILNENTQNVTKETFWESLKYANPYKFPCSSTLEGKTLPAVFVATTNFPCNGYHILRANGTQDDDTTTETLKKNFNVKLNAVARVGEYALELLSKNFQILNQFKIYDNQRAEYVINACICLHNLLLHSVTSRELYMATTTRRRNDILQEQKTTAEIFHQWQDNVTNEELRNLYAEHFFANQI